ncbi:MAG TPA: hypothetical protein VLW26_08880 [Steroidobacteraceae bacterium]|nr:hypothetical protein [Steroidobacteraceae bacterium]
MIRRTASLLVLLLVAAWTPAAQPPVERQRVFARLPDWTGIWMVDDGLWNKTGLRNGFDPQPGVTFLLLKDLPLSAAGQKRAQAAREAQKAKPTKECGFYFPFVMESPWPFEVLSTPEQTVFIFGGREIRHVYTDGRGHLPTDEIWPTPWGDSTGHWEGDTLVIETIAVDPQLLPLNADAHFAERIRKIGRDRLEDVLTIVDPVNLTRPFTVTLPYKRVTTVDRLIHGDCMQNDRNTVVNGQESVAPPTP